MWVTVKELLQRTVLCLWVVCIGAVTAWKMYRHPFKRWPWFWKSQCTRVIDDSRVRWQTSQARSLHSLRSKPQQCRELKYCLYVTRHRVEFRVTRWAVGGVWYANEVEMCLKFSPDQRSVVPKNFIELNFV